MSGLSSNALAFGTPQNKLKYNGKEEQKAEFSDGSGLDWLDYGARMYDAQIGRWGVMDKYSEIYRQVSPYQYALNNPVRLIDRAGNFIVDKDGKIIASPVLTSGGQIQTTTISRAINGYNVTAEYEVYTIKTNAGTPVEAWKLKSQTVTDGNDNIVSDSPIDMSSNCYGYSLSSGLFYLPIYEKYGKEDDKKGDVFLSQILKEEGIIVDWGKATLSENNSDGFVLTTGSKDYQHIATKNNTNGKWKAKHGYFRAIEGSKNQAASRFDTPSSITETDYFKDNRPRKNYTGISVDVESVRQNSSSNADFWNKISSLLNQF